ncbi:MAG: hypothetical protein M1836_006971 [Candelina mexicana]|nr:MAG: hypothetical protein M1836_006971 [Candelina mexicana]
MGTNSQFDLLSEEIVSLILEHIRNSSSGGALLQSLLTCQRWNRIGTPILYRDIFIRNNTLTTSVASLIAHSDQVHSLSVRLQPCEVEMYTPEGQQDYVKVPRDDPYQLRTEGSKATQSLWQALEAFATVISRMPKLSTFSLLLEPPSGTRKHGFWIHLRCLDAILEALPKSVSNLEVDLGLLDEARDDGPAHICPTLRRLLPQLAHLRLRLGTVCAALFDNGEEALTALQLETLVMNTSTSVQDCCKCDVLGSYRYNRHRAHVMDKSSKADYWPSTCLAAYQAGCFPNIKRFDVFAFEQDDSWPDEDEDIEDEEEDSLDPAALRADHWNQHNILAQKTYRLPWRLVSQHACGIMLRTAMHEEVFGDDYAIEQKVEGPAWVEMVGCLRFPVSFARSEEAVSRGYVWRDLRLEDREAFSTRTNFGLEIWGYEEREGRWIMDVEEVDYL